MAENITDRSEFRSALRRHSVPQKAVADVIGVSETTISLWLKGEVSSPRLDSAIPAYVAGLQRGLECRTVGA